MPRASTGRPGHRSGGSRFGLQNWRVRSRLIALILLPTAVAVLVTGIQLTGAINTGTEYRRLTEVAQVIDRLSTLSHEMGLERDLTAWYIADGRRNARYTKVQEQRDRVDMAKAEVMDLLLGLDGGQGQRVKNKVATVRRWLDGLSGLRKLILESRSPARAAVGTYTRMIADFTTLHDELGRDSNDDRLFGDAAALGALTRAKEALSQQIGIMLVTLSTNRFDSDDFADFLAARERQESEVATFKAEATAADAAFYNSTVRGQQVDEADRIRALVLARTRENRAIAQRLTPTAKNPAQAYFDGADATVKKMRVVEKRLATTVVAESTALKEQEQRQAFISGAAILVLLLLVLLVTSRVATSLVRPLRRLRSEALEIAGRRLPDTVQFLRESGDMAPAPEIAPIGVASRDEVGEVARAFDEVHREAIRLAGDEARLRSNVNAMFVNLSRRSQTLVERQLTLIESLEQGEDDETRLGHLFRLDHLATRMRRNSENLLVLAGQEPARRWSQPVPLLDIIRAALSEVENFERVTLQVQQGVSVLGQSVNDVVHLVAELVENAISFSPMETKVTITTSLIDGGLTISVSDLGIGMSADEVSQANWRLANPPVVDVSVSRRMGLFVVGRLALRHGIRVQLRQQDRGGLTAMVLLPDEVLAGHGAPSGGDRAVMADATGPLPMFGLQEPPPGFGTMQPPSRNGHGSAYPDEHPDRPRLEGPKPPESFRRAELPKRSERSERPEWPRYQDRSWPPAETPAFGADGPDLPAPSPTADLRGPLAPAPTGDPSVIDPFDNVPHFDKSAFERDPFEQHPFQRRRDEDGTPGFMGLPGFGDGDEDGDGDHTRELPAVGISPMESEDEFLPIFAAVESGWFRRADLPDEAGGPVDEPVNESLNEPSHRPESPDAEWASPADAGWHAAQAASAPASGGLTPAGLPRRVPKANLVPGSAAPAAGRPEIPAPILSPDRIRSRLSSFQRGIRQGRAVARGDLSEGEGYPGIMPNVDGYKEDT